MQKNQHSHRKYQEYKPLIIVVALCLLMAFAQNYGYFFIFNAVMYSFMAYFFIFLSLFKFFDLKGFADAFASYDMLARKYRVYGLAYPFIELGLGLGYLMQSDLYIVNWITLVVMLVSGASVVKTLRKRNHIKCACLGTAFNVPLSTVSLVENFGMAVMAAYQLITF